MTIREMLQKTDRLRDQLKKLQPLKQEDEQRLWKKFRLDWNYNSNHMEGNTLTYGHTEQLLIFDQVSGDYTGREIEEMKAHDVAIKMVVELAKEKERDLTESFIRQLNELILVRPFWKEAITTDGKPTRREIIPGEYKKFPNSVLLENGEIFNYASPEETAALMTELMEFYKTNVISTEVHPLWLAAMVHYKFVRVHPFDDGNGRVARLLMNYVLLRNNLPPLVIKASEKKAYLVALNKADTGDLESFVLYIGEQLNWSLQLSIKAAKGESVDELGDLDKKILQLKRKLNVNEADEVKIVKNAESIQNTFESGIKPLYQSVVDKLKKFDVLFKSKSIELWFRVHGMSDQGPFPPDNLKNFFAFLKSYGNGIQEIMFYYRLKGLRNSYADFNTEVKIEFLFHEHVYEIKSQYLNETYNKLYDEIITEYESEIISEALGNKILEKIESALSPTPQKQSGAGNRH